VIYNGDERVSIQLWGGLIADFSLPLLLILVFLAGFCLR
jgi:putative membrane protein